MISSLAQKIWHARRRVVKRRELAVGKESNNCSSHTFRTDGNDPKLSSLKPQLKPDMPKVDFSN